MSLNQPQGVVVVPRGNVLATETGGTNRIDEYAPGSPNAKLELPTSGAGTPTELAIDCNEAILYVSAFDTGIVSGVDYPLPGQSLFGKDQVSPVIQGTTVDNNQNL
jgi:DNA-binding beta-propeller fold protein YncE